MSPTILYVEDSALNLRMMHTVLFRMGYNMTSAVDGVSGLITAKETLPDLILMDINLPYMDGLEATRRLKADPKTAHIPIVAVTANVMYGDRDRCLAAGCSEYIPKPVSLKDLRRVIENLVNESV